jgi:hypothetical protein
MEYSKKDILNVENVSFTSKDLVIAHVVDLD